MGEINNLKDKWFTDTRASSHMCNHRSWMKNVRAYVGTDSIRVGDGTYSQVEATGEVDLIAMVNGQKVELTLSNVPYVPKLITNLVSIGTVTKNGGDAWFGSGGCAISLKGITVTVGNQLTANLFLLRIAPSVSKKSERVNSVVWYLQSCFIFLQLRAFIP